MPGETFEVGSPWVVNRLDPLETLLRYCKVAGEGVKSLCHMPLVSRNRMLRDFWLYPTAGERVRAQEVASCPSRKPSSYGLGERTGLWGNSDLKDKLAQEKLY